MLTSFFYLEKMGENGTWWHSRWYPYTGYDKTRVDSQSKVIIKVILKHVQKHVRMIKLIKKCQND